MDFKEIEKLSCFYKVLGEKNRLGILMLLEKEDMCVHQLMCKLNISQSLVSHQLKILRDANVVITRRRGNEIVYSLADKHIAILLDIAKEHINEDK
ncbi:MAG: winged helix-turn-helix transcriptional regulator [Clostridia bacterium]|nr:winged helix-turn-helix transcriptional regulator [Clostridia bacterium]